MLHGRRPAGRCALRATGGAMQGADRRRRDDGGLRIDQARRPRALQRETVRLRKAVARLTLDRLILRAAASGNL